MNYHCPPALERNAILLHNFLSFRVKSTALSLFAAVHIPSLAGLTPWQPHTQMHKQTNKENWLHESGQFWITNKLMLMWNKFCKTSRLYTASSTIFCRIVIALTHAWELPTNQEKAEYQPYECNLTQKSILNHTLSGQQHLTPQTCTQKDGNMESTFLSEAWMNTEYPAQFSISNTAVITY